MLTNNYDTFQAWDSHFTGNARAWCVLVLTQVFVRALPFMQSMWSPSQQPSLEIIAKVGDPVPIAAWWTGRILQARNPVYTSCPKRGSDQGPLDRGAEREPLHHHADILNT